MALALHTNDTNTVVAIRVALALRLVTPMATVKWEGKRWWRGTI